MTLNLSNLYTRTLSSMNSVTISSNDVVKRWKNRDISTFERVKTMVPSLAMLVFRCAQAFVAVVFETLTLPVRYSFNLYRFNRQIENDINKIPEANLKELRGKIEAVITKERLKLSGKEKENYIRGGSFYVL